MRKYKILFSILFLLLPIFQVSTVLALTPFPSFNSYFEYYPAKAGSGQANSIVFNVTPEQLYGQEFFGIEIPITDNRATIPKPTSTDTNINQSGWSKSGWTCTTSAFSVRCLGTTPMSQSVKTCIAIYFGGAFVPPQYLSINILDASGAKKVGLGVEYKSSGDIVITDQDIKTTVPDANSADVPMEPTSVEMPQLPPTDVDLKGSDDWENTNIGGTQKNQISNRVFNTINILVFCGLFVFGAGTSFLAGRSLRYKSLGIGFAVAMIGTGITVFFGLTDRFIGWACPNKCEIGECRNFQISKIVLVKYGDDPEGISKEKVVLNLLDQLIKPRLAPDPYTKAVSYTLKNAAKMFKLLGEAFSENEAMRDKIQNGVQLYIYYQREKCESKTSCWGLPCIYYDWTHQDFGPVKISPPGPEYGSVKKKDAGPDMMSPADIKASKQQLSVGFGIPQPDAWSLSYLTMDENTDKLAQYFSWYLKSASVAKWCE